MSTPSGRAFLAGLLLTFVTACGTSSAPTSGPPPPAVVNQTFVGMIAGTPQSFTIPSDANGVSANVSIGAASAGGGSIVQFALSSNAFFGIVPLSNALSYLVMVDADKVNTVTFPAYPTLGFNITPFTQGKTYRLQSYNVTTATWSDTGITPVIAGTTVTFVPAAGALTLAPFPPSFVELALTVQ